VKDAYKSSGNFISEQLASHFSSAVTSPRHRSKKRTEGIDVFGIVPAGTRAGSQGQFSPVESLFGLIDPPARPARPECPAFVAVSFFLPGK